MHHLFGLSPLNANEINKGIRIDQDIARVAQSPGSIIQSKSHDDEVVSVFRVLFHKVKKER